MMVPRPLPIRNTGTGLILGLVLLACVIGRAQTVSTYEMPAWFWNLPAKEGVSIAVGYAETYYTAQTSFDEAFVDAAWRLYSDRRSKIYGGQATTNTASGVLQAGRSYHIEVDTSRFGLFASRLVRLDSIVSGDLVAMLVATDTTKFSRRRTTSATDVNPQNYLLPGTLVAMGTSPQYHKEVSSWREAERNARIEAALSLSARVRSFEGNSGKFDVKTVLIETDIVLKNVVIVGHAIEIETGEHKVFVRIAEP